MEEDWSECFDHYLTGMILVRDRFTQLKLLHRVHYTPQRLSCIYPNTSSTSQSFAMEESTLFHMLWTCTHLQTYWKEVISTVNSVCGLSVAQDPLIFLLGLTDNIANTHYVKLLIYYSAFYTRWTILMKWTAPQPSTVAK